MPTKTDARDSKFALKSKTIIGSLLLLLTVLQPVLALFGVELDVNALAAHTDAIAGVIGLALVTWGRITADRPLRFLPRQKQTLLGLVLCCALLPAAVSCKSAQRETVARGIYTTAGIISNMAAVWAASYAAGAGGGAAVPGVLSDDVPNGVQARFGVELE